MWSLLLEKMSNRVPSPCCCLIVERTLDDSTIVKINRGPTSDVDLKKGSVLRYSNIFPVSIEKDKVSRSRAFNIILVAPRDIEELITIIRGVDSTANLFFTLGLASLLIIIPISEDIGPFVSCLTQERVRFFLSTGLSHQIERR
jgi:hypothetical protein